MDSYQFDKVIEQLSKINEQLFYLNYPQLKPKLEQKEQSKVNGAAV